MTRLISLAFFLYAFSSLAQVTIESFDLPQPGKSYIRSNSTATNLDLTQTGPNQIWDFRDLVRSSRDTIIFQDVSQTPLFYQIMFNNPLNPPYKASEARKSPDVNIGGFLDLSNNYLFSQNSANTWNEIGIGTTIMGAPIPTQYSDIKTKLNLPLNYNDANSDNYAYLIQVPTFGTIGQSGTLNYVVDGWGILKTPGGTFNVLRVKTDIIKADTVYVNLIGIGTSIPSMETTYEWYTQNEGYPVLSVATQLGTITSVQFADDLTTSITQQNFVIEKNSIYPNPVKGLLHLRLTGDDLKITILDISGKVVMQPDQLSPKVLDMSPLPKGIYFIKYTNSHTNEVQQFVKQ